MALSREHDIGHDIGMVSNSNVHFRIFNNMPRLRYLKDNVLKELVHRKFCDYHVRLSELGEILHYNTDYRKLKRAHPLY